MKPAPNQEDTRRQIKDNDALTYITYLTDPNGDLAEIAIGDDYRQYKDQLVSNELLKVVDKEFDDTVRGLTDAGQAVIAVGAVAITFATGGIGAGISGAMMTAAATTAGTTATISATNAGMNAEGDGWKKLKSTSKTAWDDTTSRESFENMAVAAVVAGAASWAVQASGGNTSLESGGDAVYKPDPNLMRTDPQYRAFVETNYPNYNGVIDPGVNNIGLANPAPRPELIGTPVPSYSNNPFTINFWEGFAKEGGFVSKTANKAGGMNAMSVSHDGWGQNFIVNKPPLLQISIAPAIAMQYCAVSPAACGVIVNKDNLINKE